MLEIEYLTDKTGEQKAVVIPIELWRKLLAGESPSIEGISEGIENYCLNKAMDEAQETPLISRDEALEYLDK
jgi:hypothetical protein